MCACAYLERSLESLKRQHVVCWGWDSTGNSNTPTATAIPGLLQKRVAIMGDDMVPNVNCGLPSSTSTSNAWYYVQNRTTDIGSKRPMSVVHGRGPGFHNTFCTYNTTLFVL